MLSQEEGDDGRVVQKIGGRLCAPRMDGDRIRAYVGRCRKVESAEVLERIAREGVPAKVWAGGNLESGMEYGNHRLEVRGRGAKESGDGRGPG